MEEKSVKKNAVVSNDGKVSTDVLSKFEGSQEYVPVVNVNGNAQVKINNVNGLVKKLKEQNLDKFEITITSPIDNENRVLSQEEHCCYKRVTAVIAVVFLTITVLLYMCNMEKYSVCISIGMILSAGLQLPCICKKLAHYLFSMEK